MKSRLRNNNAGMSLVEVLIAMVMLAVISVPLIKYFTDSMSHSIKTAQKQQATAEAQALMEDLEAQYMLVNEQADASGNMAYDAYYLIEQGYSKVTGDSSLGFDPDGVGRQIYRKAGTDYDYEVIVETDMTFNTTAHPAINAVDDTTDVFAAETNQLTEALLHFQAVNQSYASQNGVTPLTLDQIKRVMEKTIKVELGKTTSGYTIDVYYEYTCKGRNWPGSPDTYISNSLYVGEKKEIKNLYILYNRKDCMVQNVPDIDRVVITRDLSAMSACPELYLVCQNAVADSNYQIRMTALPNQIIHSNIGNTSDSTKGIVKPGAGGYRLTILPITGDEETLRIADITVNLYKSGYVADPDPDTATLFVTMSSTKGE